MPRVSQVEPQVRLETTRSPLQSWRPGGGLSTIEQYGRFDILGRIGRGGMAEILLARERGSLGAVRNLVIKRILPEVADNDEMLHMFLDEARLVMGLSHPNLCQIYDVGEQDGTWYIAMEWVNGATLHELIRRAGGVAHLDPEVMASIISQCAEALDHAHHARDSEGNLVHLVHRDVSPHNIMVAFDGRVKLLDFGIAKTAVSTHRTEAGIVKGKVCYLAPEQWRTAPVDMRTDIFSLGCCLFEALSGRVLFRRDTQAEVMRAVLEDNVPALSDEVPGIPKALSAIAARALALDPDARFQSALAMSDALEAYLTSTVGTVRPSRIAAFVRTLFRAEVELGPVLERAVRGALLEEAALHGAPSLPPVPYALRTLSVPPASSRRAGNHRLPAPGLDLARSFSLPPPRMSVPPPAVGRLSEASLMTMDVAVDEGATSGELSAREAEVLATPPANDQGLSNERSAARPGFRAALVVALVAVLGVSTGAYVLLRAQSGHVAHEGAQFASARPVPSRVDVPPVAAHPQAPGMTETRASEASASDQSAALELADDSGEDAQELGEPAAVVSARPRIAGRAARPSRLSVNTRPWSTVYLGKRLLGTTPLAQVAVPAGPLSLRFVDRNGVSRVRALARAKQPLRSVFYDFTAEPAKKRKR